MSGRRAAVVAVVAVLVGGCAGQVPDEWSEEHRPGRVHQDPLGAYAIVLPPGWVLDPDYPSYSLLDDEERDFPERDVAFAEQAVLDDPAEDPKFAPQIRVDVDVWGGTLTDAVDRRREGLSAQYPPLTVDEPVVLPDGTPAHMMGASYDSAVDVESRYLLVVNGSTLVTVEASGHGEEWQRYLGLYDAAMRSVTTPVDARQPTGTELIGHRAGPGVPFRDDEGTFTIVPPAGWLISGSSPDGNEDRDRWVRFSSGDRTGERAPASIGVSVTVPDQFPTLADRVVSQRLGHSYDYDRDEPTALADGTPAHLFVSEDDRFLVLVAMARGELYEIDASAKNRQEWERNRAAIDASVRSFTIS